MAEFFVWETTTNQGRGSRRPASGGPPPNRRKGMTRAFEWVSDDGRTVVGVSHWTGSEACERYRASDAEEERRARMAPFVESKTPTYSGRELTIPSG